MHQVAKLFGVMALALCGACGSPESQATGASCVPPGTYAARYELVSGNCPQTTDVHIEVPSGPSSPDAGNGIVVHRPVASGSEDGGTSCGYEDTTTLPWADGPTASGTVVLHEAITFTKEPSLGLVGRGRAIIDINVPPESCHGEYRVVVMKY